MVKMDAMEEVVRRRLAEKERKKWEKYLPEYNEAISKAINEYYTRVSERLREMLSLDDREVEELLKEIGVDTIIEKILENLSPEKIGDIYLENVDMVKAEIQERIAKLRNNELRAVDMDFLKSYLFDGLDLVRVRDIKVEKLTEIAKKKGIEKALKDEIIYKVTREIFPTEEDFRKYTERYKKYIKGLFENMGGIFYPIREKEPDIWTAIEPIFSEITIIYNAFFNFYDKIKEEEIREIYGKSKK